MNNPSPLVPQGSLMEQKNKSRSRVKLAFFCVVGVHVVGLMVLLMQGCKREQPQPAADEQAMPTMTDTNMPPVDTNFPPVAIDTNIHAAPPIVDTTIPPIAPTAQEYVIQKGDSFYSISKKLHVSMKAIQEANPNVNPSKLQIGQKIVIPAATIPPAGAMAPGAPTAAPLGGEQTYTVKSGDTLTKIAKDHGTTVKALTSANNLTTTKIKVGQKLVIPAKATSPVPPVEPVPVTPPAAPEASPTPAPGQ